MEDDEDVIKLANKIAESKDENVPILLLHIADVLKKYQHNSKEQQKLKKDIWNYDLLSWCSLTLKYDFDHISGKNETAIRIIEILCQCCVGINIEESQEFSQTTLPDALQSSLQLCWKLQQLHLVNAPRNFLNLFLRILESLTLLLSSHIYLIKYMFGSENMLRLLMDEDETKSEFTVGMIKFLLKCLHLNIFGITQTKRSMVNSIMDELVYKLSVSSNKNIVSISIKVLIEISNSDSTLFTTISTRFKGLKAILKKWKGQGLDHDVNNLTLVLESGNMKAAELAVKAKAVAVIIAAYRGWKTRTRVKNLHKVIPNLQGSFRQKIKEKRSNEIEHKAREEQDRMKQLDLRRNIRSSKQKRLEMLKIVPASSVSSHIIHEEQKAALKIQSVWRGIVTRRAYDEKLNLHKLSMSAILIQRAVRKFLERRRKLHRQKHPEINYENLSSDRKKELDLQIKQWQAVHKREEVPASQVEEIHNKTQEMLKSFHLNLIKENRINKPRRDALLAMLHTEHDLMESLPSLKDATHADVDKMASNSVAVKIAAENEHRKMITELTAPWWKKLELKDNEEKKLFQ